MPLTSVIISTKNRPKALRKLLDSIGYHTKNYELVLHDDAIGTSIPVADAWNKCAEKAKGKYLVFLNDDMLVTPHWVDNQIEFYKKHPLIGSLAYLVYDDQGQVQSRGHSFNGLHPYLPPEDAITVDYSDHPFMEKKVWEKVGGFDTYGQLYYEDAGMGLKLLSRGYFNYYNHKAILIHQTIGLRIGTKEDKEKRHHNETVVQQKSKFNFYRSWGPYLNSRNE